MCQKCLHILAYLIQTTRQPGIIIISISEVRRQKLRDVKSPGQGHTLRSGASQHHNAALNALSETHHRKTEKENSTLTF